MSYVCKRGDEVTDFEKIYTEYFKDVYKYLFSLCRNDDIACELAEQTFIKAMQRIDRFDGKCKLYVWLCQIAKNTYFSFLKKNKRTVPLEELENEAAEETAEEIFIKNEAAFNIHKVLHSLDEPYKEVFSLRVFGELSFAQVGELFGRPESWARVTYHRAKLKIKEKMNEFTL